MVTVQVSMCLPQIVRSKKVEEISNSIQDVLKTLSRKEAKAVDNAFQSSAFDIQNSEPVPWM
jgi:hypothetical protein